MTGARNNYSRLIAKYKELGKGNVRLTESTLTLIQPISASKTSYMFPVLENDNSNGLAPTPDEIRLNINDEFIVGSIGLYLYGVKRNRDTEAKPLENEKFIHTYSPNELSSVFNKVGDFYSGFLSVAVNKINYIDKWDIRKHCYVPRTQWSNFVPATAAIGSTPATQPTKNLENDGVFNAQPNFTLSGAKKNEVSISLPNAISPSSAVWTSQDGVGQDIIIDRMVIIFRGLLAQNAARFQQ